MSILKVGSNIHDYTIVKLLGQNPLGATYLGQRQTFDPMTGQKIIKDYALKTINLTKLNDPSIGLDPAVVEAEAKVLKQISGNPVCNRYITCYYDYFTTEVVQGDQNMQYLIVVTDHIDGVTLQQMLLNQKGNVPMAKLLQMMVEIAQAVDYIHNHGLAHQNIKPSNIIYDPVLKRLRLIDFAFSCSQNLNSKCTGKAGTAYYMPPELIELPTDPSEQDFAFRAAHDIWSLGVVFYQMANIGQDYIQFNSNDPESIAKDIQIKPVKLSKYPYEPINSVIGVMLNKDYSVRPTSGQVNILLRLARPVCIVNEKPIDRGMADAIVESLGVEVDPDLDDYELCKTVTDYLNICKIKDNEYQKKHLLKLAHILGIKVTEDVQSVDLCENIQKGLQEHQEAYSSYVTQSLLRTIEYLAFISIRAKSEVNGQLKDILTNLQESYAELYTEAKKLDLINLKMLEARRNDATLKSLVYRQNASVAFANVYADLANRIVRVIIDLNPDAEVGGIPIAEFQRRMQGYSIVDQQS